MKFKESIGYLMICTTPAKNVDLSIVSSPSRLHFSNDSLQLAFSFTLRKVSHVVVLGGHFDKPVEKVVIQIKVLVHLDEHRSYNLKKKDLKKIHSCQLFFSKLQILLAHTELKSVLETGNNHKK